MAGFKFKDWFLYNVAAHECLIGLDWIGLRGVKDDFFILDYNLVKKNLCILLKKISWTNTKYKKIILEK